MPQAKAQLELKTFKAGLQTESTPVNGGMASALEMSNFRLSLDGSVSVRENLASTFPTSLSGTAASGNLGYEKSFSWTRPTGFDKPVVVFNRRGVLNFFSVDNTGTVPTLTSIPTNFYSLDPTEQDLVMSMQHSSAQFATVGGDLIVGGHRLCYKYAFDADSATPSILITYFTIEVNDVFGIEDGTSIDNPALWYGNPDPSFGQSPYTTTRHNYNVMNQGFKADDLLSYGASVPASPNNWSLYPAGVSADYEFDHVVQEKADLINLNVKAPRGSNKVELLWRGGSRKSFMDKNATNVPDTDRTAVVAYNPAYMLEDGHARIFQSTQTASHNGDFGWLVASHAGRAWYSYRDPKPYQLESTAPKMSSLVAFSRSVTEDGSEGKCITQNDPAGVISDVLDSDGGFIIIEGARTIRALVPFQDQMIVFAEEGVWAIYSDGLFTATNYGVRKISDSGILPVLSAAEMIVSLGSSLSYWSREGIELIEADVQSGRLNITNSTRATVDRKYTEYSRRELLTSCFDYSTSIIKWVTKDTATGEYFELLLNTSTGTFYEYVLEELETTGTNYIVGCIELLDSDSKEGKQGYLVVTDDSVDSAVNYDTIKIAYFNGSTAFVEAKILTNVDTFGDASKRKNAAQLTVYMEQTEKTQNATGLDDESSCLVQTRWDFADSIASNKIGKEFEAYRLRRMPASSTTDFDYGFDTVVTRNKIRGRGRALAIQFRSQPGKKCHLYGFSLDVASNAVT